MRNRRRLSPDESRAAAVAAARQLLRDEGVAAVTLKSVAAKIGRTHANLLHHFGTVAGLHRALAEDIATTVSASISEAIGKRRRGEASERDVVDAMFDAFAAERVLSMAVITPGATGLVELGMTGTLVAFGVDPATAAAGVLLYRAFIIGLEIPFGGTALLWWLIRTRRVRRAVRLQGAGSPGAEDADAQHAEGAEAGRTLSRP